MCPSVRPFFRRICHVGNISEHFSHSFAQKKGKDDDDDGDHDHHEKWKNVVVCADAVPHHSILYYSKFPSYHSSDSSKVTRVGNMQHDDFYDGDDEHLLDDDSIHSQSKKKREKRKREGTTTRGNAGLLLKLKMAKNRKLLLKEMTAKR